MTIRDTTTATAEPEFSLLDPVYEYDSSNQQQQTTLGNATTPTSYYGTASAPVEPTSTATALTTGQSFRREDQLITIPSSNVLVDTSRPTRTTVKKTKTTRATDVTPLADAGNSSSSNNHNNNNNNTRQSKYV